MTINYYNKNAEAFFENTVNADMKNTYIEFEKYLSKNSSVLDLGCGSGRDSKYFLKQGYSVTSVDLSEELIKKASEHLGQEVLKLDMRDINFKNEFDGIWACASILHIPKNEVLNVINRCYLSLKENGILYASFKYGNTEGIRNGRFFNYYDESSIKNLLNETDFKLEKLWITNDVRKDRENEKWLNIIVKKLKKD